MKKKKKTFCSEVTADFNLCLWSGRIHNILIIIFIIVINNNNNNFQKENTAFVISISI